MPRGAAPRERCGGPLDAGSAKATAGQLLITQRLHAEVEDDIEVESVGEFTLKGFQRPVAAFNVLAVREQAMELASPRTTGLAAEAQGRR